MGPLRSSSVLAMSMESLSPRERVSIHLYLDKNTRETFSFEASRVGISFSAYLRVVARVLSEWANSKPSRSMEDFHRRIREIIVEESRRV